MTKIYDEWLILRDNCYTCKHRYVNICNIMNVELHDLDFSCDFHKRKNSGAFRRKRRKVNKEYMSRYEENSFSKANKIINNLSDNTNENKYTYDEEQAEEMYNMIKGGAVALLLEGKDEEVEEYIETIIKTLEEVIKRIRELKYKR